MKKQTTVFTLTLLFYINAAFSQWNCGDTLIDTRDGKKYTTVLIGSQCWMKQNLNYGKTVLSYTSTVTHSDMYNDSIAEKYAPNGDTTKVPQYGGLYEWNELMNYDTVQGGKGLCPTGWHVPTDIEWNTMIITSGGTVNPGSGGNGLKAIGEGFGQGAGTNTSGFSAKAAGDRDSYGIFYGLGVRFIFWTSKQTGPGSAYHYTLWAESDTIEHLITQKITGLSCRCIKDASTSGMLEESSPDENILIYPNPSTSGIYVHDDNFSSENNYAVRIENGIGQIILTQKQTTQYVYIDLSLFRKGIYFVHIIDKSGTSVRVKKIVIQ